MSKKATLTISILFFLLSAFIFGQNGFDAFTAKRNIPSFDCTSYSPYKNDVNQYTSPEEIRRDLEIIRSYTQCVRIYTTKNGLHVVPAIAQELGLDVILGTWIDKTSLIANKREIDRAIELSKIYPNVRMIVVGNEVNAFQWAKIDKLTYVSYLKYIKSKTDIPLAITILPESAPYEFGLFEHVDIIGLHVFPYWSSVDDLHDQPDFTLKQVELVRAFIEETLRLKKDIQVLEYGQPWAGPSKSSNVPSLRQQRQHAEQMTKELRDAGIFANYYELLSEKRMNDLDGYLYRLWGVLTHNGKNIVDVQRMLFVLIFLGVLVAYLSTLYYARRLRLTVTLSSYFYLAGIYLLFGYMLFVVRTIFRNDYLIRQLLYLLPIVALAGTCVKIIFEFSTKYISRDKRKEVPDSKVAIIIPSKAEDLEIIRKTLASCLAQTHAHIQIIFVNNGPQSEEYARDLKKLCESFNDSRLTYLYFQNEAKNKSSVLNFALGYVDSVAEYVLFVDVDYVLVTEAVQKGLSYFAADDIAAVQFPQVYGRSNVYVSEMARIEQVYVAHLLQPFRNKTNSVIINGTLCFFRKNVFDTYAWDEKTICEDAQLGVELELDGKRVAYVQEEIGQGLAPRNIQELIIQRFRWAAGASQVLRTMLLSRKAYKKPAILAQYILGWLPWLILIAACICIPLHLVFLYNINSYFQFFTVFIPVQLTLALVMISLLWFSFVHINERIQIGKKTFLNSIAFQLALVNTIALGMMYGFLARKMNFTATRSVLRNNTYVWLLPLGVSLCLIYMAYLLLIRNWHVDNSYTELNILAPVLFTLFPQLAQIWVFAIDKFRK